MKPMNFACMSANLSVETMMCTAVCTSFNGCLTAGCSRCAKECICFDSLSCVEGVQTLMVVKQANIAIRSIWSELISEVSEVLQQQLLAMVPNEFLSLHECRSCANCWSQTGYTVWDNALTVAPMGQHSLTFTNNSHFIYWSWQSCTCVTWHLLQAINCTRAVKMTSSKTYSMPRVSTLKRN